MSEREALIRRLLKQYGSAGAIKEAISRTPKYSGVSMPGSPPTNAQQVALIEQSYPDALLGQQPPPPNIKDLMRTDGVPVQGYEEMYGQVPEGGMGGGSVAGLSPWQGTPMGTSSYDPSIYGPTQSAMGDTRVADPYAFEPEYAGERLLPSAHEPGIASLLDVSPEQKTAMQEQIGGPGAYWAPPRFTANNGAIRTRHIMESDRTDPNFYSPFAAGASPLNLSPEDRALQQQNFNSPQQKGGILATSPEETNDRSGWDRDERWRNASNRNNRWQELLGMGLLNMSNNMMRENTF